MKNTFGVKMVYNFYHSAVKTELKRRGLPKELAEKIDSEHKKILARAKDIGRSRLLSSYIMASYFIAMNRGTGLSAEENYEIYRDGLCASKLFHKVLGDAESYLDPKRWKADCNGRPKATSASMKTTGW